MLKDKLQIYLLTYNRKNELHHTLKTLLSETSPIKNAQITILDNASTDGSSELIDDYCEKFQNLKHIRHNINIGGNANICRALEMASTCGKKYFWILCDDDTLKFKHWEKVENAIKTDKYDCIIVEKKINFKSDDFPNIINTLSFLPAGIYKTENINSTVIHNAYSNIMYSFPHLALGCHLLNIKANFYISKFRIIKQGINDSLLKKSNTKNKENDFTRGTNKELHFRSQHINLFSSLINSYQMIQDKKLRMKCCNTLYIGKSFNYSVYQFLLTNSSKYNMNDFFLGINFKKKFQFVIITIFYYTILSIIKFEKRKNGIYINILNKFKTKIIPYKKSK
ncbi:glycosyltransferase family 2 protein [bacterium]|nr:glycosyltransferase family 2 protein [bacterium]